MSSWFGRLFGKTEAPPPTRSPRPPGARPSAARPQPPRPGAAAVPSDAERRSARVVVRVPVSLQRDGRAITAITAVVNAQGGLLLSPEDWPLGTECRMKHLDSGRTAKVTIVWNGGLDELGSYKLGIEFLDAAEGFWGAEFSAESSPAGVRSRRV